MEMLRIMTSIKDLVGLACTMTFLAMKICAASFSMLLIADTKVPHPLLYENDVIIAWYNRFLPMRVLSSIDKQKISSKIRQ